MWWLALWFACTGSESRPESGETTPSSSDETGLDSTVDSGDSVGPTASTGATGASGETGVMPVLVPDFALNDRNPTSATFDQLVSPRDQIGRVSVWYFGHST